MLTNIQAVQQIPGNANLAAVPQAWLNAVLLAADNAVKKYCKQYLELNTWTQYLDGNTCRELILKEGPVLSGTTTIAAGSNGVALPTGTINVASTSAFNPGNTLVAPTIGVQTGVNTWSTVTYTGTTATSFTGCTGGTGTMSTGGQVFSPQVWFDPNGYGGQTINGFNDKTMLIQGLQFITEIDGAEGQLSHRALLKRIGGAGAGFVGFFPENLYAGKLGAYRMPAWPRGDRNIKVTYSAGYNIIPADLAYAVGMLVVQMVRIQPTGANLSSENLGGYSYSVLVNSDNPEMGELRRTLAPYREVAW